jgi:hypothetical protein
LRVNIPAAITADLLDGGIVVVPVPGASSIASRGFLAAGHSSSGNGTGRNLCLDSEFIVPKACAEKH